MSFSIQIRHETLRCCSSHQPIGEQLPLVSHMAGDLRVITLPETNTSHVKMDGWNTTFLFGKASFQGLC